MNSKDLASEERLKEIKQYEKEALKSLVRIDDTIPAKPLTHGSQEMDGLPTASTVVIPEAIDLDSIVDLDDSNSRTAEPHSATSQSILLNGAPQSNFLDQAITSSASAYFPLYPMSPGALGGPSGLGLSASTEGYPRRLSPIGIVTEEDAAFYSVQRGYAPPDNGRPSNPNPRASGEVDHDESDHLEALIREYYDGEGGNAGAQEDVPSFPATRGSLGEEEFKRKRIVWEGEVSQLPFLR